MSSSVVTVITTLLQQLSSDTRRAKAAKVEEWETIEMATNESGVHTTVVFSTN